MTVAELIEKLKDHPPDMRVVLGTLSPGGEWYAADMRVDVLPEPLVARTDGINELGEREDGSAETETGPYTFHVHKTYRKTFERCCAIVPATYGADEGGS